MHDVGILRDLVVLVGVAIPVVALAHRFGIPSVTGFLLAGVATGPHGLGLIGSQDSVADVSELGVVLLLFTICILFLGLGAAFLTASFGMSLALGAFLAGLVISESEYGLQALSDVLPFRDTFTSVFFTSIGMLLDVGYVVDNALLVAATAVALLKTLVTTAVVLTLGHSLVTSLIAGVSLAQADEFSFVLAGVGAPFGLFASDHYRLFLAASGLTMLATPALIASARPIAEKVSSTFGMTGVLKPPPEELARAEGLSDHAVIVGYGLSGRHLQQVLAAAGIAHVVLEQNGKIVREARAAGVPILFGDGTRREVLERVGLSKARVVVFVISSPTDERRGVATAHDVNPGVKNVVRTRYVRSIDDLMRLGASEVVVEEYEATIELFARVLEGYDVPTYTIHRELEAIRAEHYQLLRREDRPPLALDALKHLGIHRALDMVEVEEGSMALGESPTSLQLRRQTGAVVIAVVRDGKAIYQRDPDFAFRPGDIVVAVGDRESLDRTANIFRRMP